MSVLGISEGLLAGYLDLFVGAEIFIFVSMEIVTKLDAIQRVTFKKARLPDYAVFILRVCSEVWCTASTGEDYWGSFRRWHSPLVLSCFTLG